MREIDRCPSCGFVYCQCEEMGAKIELLNHRYEEQIQKKDYSYLDNGEIEKCECGRRINSHGHCPRCDY